MKMGNYEGEVELIDGTIINATGKELFILDDKKPLSIVAYMDTKYGAIGEETREAMFVPHIVQGVPAALALWSLRRLSDILKTMGAKTVLEL